MKNKMFSWIEDHAFEITMTIIFICMAILIACLVIAVICACNGTLNVKSSSASDAVINNMQITVRICMGIG